MRQRLAVAVAFILLCTFQAWPAASQQTGPKKRIAVAKFDTIGSFSAEYGSNGGTVVNVLLKSGTNKFHGSG